MPELPSIQKHDPDHTIKDIPGLFEHIMLSTDPGDGTFRLPLRMLNKLILLTTKEEDLSVLDTAYWTYCGYKKWPSSNTTSLLV